HVAVGRQGRDREAWDLLDQCRGGHAAEEGAAPGLSRQQNARAGFVQLREEPRHDGRPGDGEPAQAQNEPPPTPDHRQAVNESDPARSAPRASLDQKGIVFVGQMPQLPGHEGPVLGSGRNGGTSSASALITPTSSSSATSRSSVCKPADTAAGSS